LGGASHDLENREVKDERRGIDFPVPFVFLSNSLQVEGLSSSIVGLPSTRVSPFWQEPLKTILCRAARKGKTMSLIRNVRSLSVVLGTDADLDTVSPKSRKGGIQEIRSRRKVKSLF